MNKWTWLVLLAVALLGGGYYLSSYQKSISGAPEGSAAKNSLNSEEFDSGEEGGEMEKDANGFEPGDAQEDSESEARAQRLFQSGQGGELDPGAGADSEAIDDQDDPAASTPAKDPGSSPATPRASPSKSGK